MDEQCEALLADGSRCRLPASFVDRDREVCWLHAARCAGCGQPTDRYAAGAAEAPALCAGCALTRLRPADGAGAQSGQAQGDV